MSINTQQVTANTSSATYLTTIPSGICSVVLTNPGSADVLVGPVATGGAISQTNALRVPKGTTLSFQTYAASKGCDLYALVATGGSSQPVSVLLSTTD